MDNFKIIYRILKYLEAAMDLAEPDMTPIMPEALGLSAERWAAIIEMLLDNGYVAGVTVKRYIRTPPLVGLSKARITLKGLEYLQENSFMKKAANLAMGLIDIVT